VNKLGIMGKIVLPNFFFLPFFIMQIANNPKLLSLGFKVRYVECVTPPRMRKNSDLLPSSSPPR